MSDPWDDAAAGWDDDAAVRAYSDAAFASLEAILARVGLELAGARVVDFGSGTGVLTERLVAAGADVVAVDTSAAMLAVLSDKVDRLGWDAVSTTTDLDRVRSGNDLVLCSSVCAFLDDYPATTVSLVDRLRPGGLFVQWDWERGGDDDHGLTRSEIQAALEGAELVGIVVDTGFEIDFEGHRMAPLVGWGRSPDGPGLPVGP